MLNADGVEHRPLRSKAVDMTRTYHEQLNKQIVDADRFASLAGADCFTSDFADALYAPIP
jgi:hypothetical protein